MSDDFPTIVHVVQSAGEILGDWVGEAYIEPKLTGIECRYIRADIAKEADRIEELEAALRRLEYWFDADQEVLDAMTPDERADHMRQLKRIREALNK